MRRADAGCGERVLLCNLSRPLVLTSPMNAIPPPSLSDFTPPLPATLVANLTSLNIRTASDLIFASPAELIGKLPAGSITFPELTHHIAHVTAAFTGPAITADKLIAELEPRAGQEPVSSSGLPALDELIAVGNDFGGAPGGRLIEISGTSASGKTALALHIALHHLTSHPAAAALWLDTTGNLAPARLASLVSRSSSQSVRLTTLCVLRFSHFLLLWLLFPLLMRGSLLVATPRTAEHRNRI